MPGWQKAGGVAPITVDRLDATKCYDGLQLWKRRVQWDANHLAVSDEVQLAPDTIDVVMFRWHLGTTVGAVFQPAPSKPQAAHQRTSLSSKEEAYCYTLTLNGLRLSIEPSAPVEISQIKLPDHALQGHTGNEDPGNVHTCIVVRSREKLAAFTCSLRAAPAE